MALQMPAMTLLTFAPPPGMQVPLLSLPHPLPTTIQGMAPELWLAPSSMWLPIRVSTLSYNVPPAAGAAFIGMKNQFIHWSMNHLSTIFLWSTLAWIGLCPRSCQLRYGLL